MATEYRDMYCASCGFETGHLIFYYPHATTCRCTICNRFNTSPAGEFERASMLKTNFKILVINMDISKDTCYKKNFALVQRTKTFAPSFGGTRSDTEVDSFLVEYSVQNGRHLCDVFRIIDPSIALDYPNTKKLAKMLKEVFVGNDGSN